MGEAAENELAIWPLDNRDAQFLDEEHYHLYLGKHEMCLICSQHRSETLIWPLDDRGATLLDEEQCHVYLGDLSQQCAIRKTAKP